MGKQIKTPPQQTQFKFKWGSKNVDMNDRTQNGGLNANVCFNI